MPNDSTDSLPTPCFIGPVSRRLRLCRGVSLVELLIVAVCISIAGMLVVPMLGASSPQQLTSAARLVVADIQFAKLRAMHASMDRVVLVVDLHEGSYHVALDSDTATAITNPADGTAYQLKFGYGRAAHLGNVRIENVEFGGSNVLTFGALGSLALGQDARITLASQTQQLSITIAGTTGRITIGQLEPL